MAFYFPFGQEVCPVSQGDKSPKKVFVLGADAGAVCATWRKDGKLLASSIIIASEPNIFWDGNISYTKDLIDELEIPEEAGILTPCAEQLNGRTAQVLDENILKPLGLSRDDVWLCECMPETRVNSTQAKIIQEKYNPLIEKLGLNPVTIPTRPFILCDKERADEITAELLQSKADTIILLGDTPISQYLKKVANIEYSTLGEYYRLYGYGVPTKAVIAEKEFEIIPLVHPKQIGALETCNKRWFDIHKEWEKSR